MTENYYIFSTQKLKYFAIGFIAALAATTALYTMPIQNLLSSMVPSAYAAGTLTNVRALPSTNVQTNAAYYTIVFNTATTGNIAKIDMLFPADFVVSQAKLIQAQNIGTGTLSISGQTVTYNVASPVSVTAPTKITIMIGSVVNGISASNNVQVTTKDAASVIIDGPTNSGAFNLAACIDSPTLCLDTSIDKVGIGTNSLLTYKLEIYDTGGLPIGATTPGLTNFIDLGAETRGASGSVAVRYNVAHLTKWKEGIWNLTAGPNTSYFLQNAQTSGSATLVVDGTTNDMSFALPGTGIILKSPDSKSCMRISIDNVPTFVTTAVACPY